MQIDSSETRLQKALAHQTAGQFTAAREIYEDILRQQPAHARALHYLGYLRHQTGDSAGGAELISRSIAIDPNVAMARNNLGAVLEAMWQIERAMAEYQRAAALDRSYAAPRFNLANIHRLAGRYKEAIEGYNSAIQIRPDYHEAYCNLGLALTGSGRLPAAVDAYRKAISLLPNHPGAYNNLAGTLWRMEHWTEAHEAIQTALRLAPNFAEAHSNLAAFLKDEGRLEEAMSEFARSAELTPGNATAHSYQIYTMLFQPGFDEGAIAAAHRLWDEQHGRPADRLAEAPAIQIETGRKLKIGYVSPDFRDHVIGRNILPLLGAHDRGKFEIFCYNDARFADHLTPAFQRNCDVWRNILGQSNKQFAQTVRLDGIDILVDLALHMAGERLAVFGYRPAPIQVTFAGYPGSTGMAAMDYRLTDPYLDPPGGESHTPEKLIRLPASFWCYDPAAMTLGPGEAIDVAPLPALTNGHITFGCLNNFCKVNENVLALWAEVLNAVPRSRLLMLAPTGARNRVVGVLNHHGIESARIEFVPKVARGQYLASHCRIDIGLDTFPYNGHTTTLDALWMGVPVITLVGRTIVGRAGLSQLSNLGLTELVAESKERYIEIANNLANDLPRLKELRAGLRDRMRASPLTDARHFARSIEAAYLEMASRSSRGESSPG